MTYRYLQKLISQMTEEQKDQDVTVYIDYEFYPTYHLLYTKYSDILDKDRPYLTAHPEDQLT